jgi:hypothetical protein
MRKAMPEAAAMKPTCKSDERMLLAYSAIKTFEVSTAQLESRLMDARQSAMETHEGGEKRRI